MAIYSAGRRRTIWILLLSSVLLITLDLRGNAVFDASRSAFEYALRPFEIAGEVVAGPVSRAWSGTTRVDDLEAEVDRLQDLVDQMRASQISGDAAVAENRALREQIGLESLANIGRVTGQIIGESPSNFDQRVEIDQGWFDGVRVGMPVTNSAGLVGKITNVFPETSQVMLITDPQYHTQVKVISRAEVAQGSAVVTVPAGLPVADVTTTTGVSTTTTLPGAPVPTMVVTDVEGRRVVITVPDGLDLSGPATPGTSTTTSTTTVAPLEVTRETGVIDGLGSGRLPRVRFIADSSQFGRIAIGDAVLTSGGSASLAPPDIPIGRVANIIENPGAAGLELEIELNADLSRLNFLTVLLYRPPTEAPGIG
ncbi:MAG: putative rod shape-determining protein MreC [Actinomycetota bacterium]